MSRTLPLASFTSISNKISSWSGTLAASPRFSPLFFSSQPLSHSSSPLPFLTTKNLLAILAMDSSKAGTVKELPVGLDEATEEEYASQSKLLQENRLPSNVFN
ncbi:acylamino-acid-releasing enzyme isoform X1 [Gossypium australe]|uniref:Acylamino-acid-releasing enzyme isoform X1 n=1 Tax=Gossypium australe TaxID=47621 RepID=A0A5B6UED5_9ROSI|nr:acylamino-acid-releasing enzyme isoform X1 [Gossypium australe]